MAKISSYKIANKLSLKKLAQEFKITGIRPGQGYIILKPGNLSEILKNTKVVGLIYITDYGCICEMGLSEYEINQVIKYISSIYSNLDMNLFFNYNDTFEADDSEDEIGVSIFESYASIISKSVELKYLESQLDGIADRTDMLLNRFLKGKSDPSGKSYIPAFTKLMRLKLNSVGTTHILDRPDSTYNSQKLKDIYDCMYEELELEDRYENFSAKIQTLTKTITPYHKHGVSLRENRLLVFEIFLLSLFPLVSLIRDFF